MVMRGGATVGTRTLTMIGRGTETIERGRDGRREKERDLTITGGESLVQFGMVACIYWPKCILRSG